MSICDRPLVENLGSDRAAIESTLRAAGADHVWNHVVNLRQLLFDTSIVRCRQSRLETIQTSVCTGADLGLVDSTFLFTYMLGQFVFGPLGDRFGPKRLLIGGMPLSIVAAVASGFSTTIIAFAAFAAVQGIAQSTGWSNTSKTMSPWFSLSERGRVIGWWCTHYTIGAAIALPFAGWMMAHYGRSVHSGQSGSTLVDFWPAAFWGPAAVLTIVLALSCLLLKNRPEDVGLPPIEKYHGEPESLIDDEVPAHVAPEVGRDRSCTGRAFGSSRYLIFPSSSLGMHSISGALVHFRKPGSDATPVP